ncbi:MAG: family 16 glycosylhydrolase, partial [Henriciella sp.]|nr:family 16 glycosylhydrolase [Henriciella sp.]
MPVPSYHAATARTWREDMLVLGLVFGLVLLGAIAFRSSVVLPAPTLVAVIDPPPSQPAPVPAPYVKPAPPDLFRSRPLGVDELIPSGPAFITLFGGGEISKSWWLADRDSDQGFWENDFRAGNIASAADGLSLSITQKRQATARRWNSGEITSTEAYGYGRYETIMKPAKGGGLISSFFTYTGPYYGDPHDEIDIEFLGKDTRRVEFNMFRSGVSSASKIVDLPFDASADFHLYAFEWHPDAITWFIDGKVKHRAEASDYALPKTPGKIMMNIWTGKMPGWHGEAAFVSG